MSKRRILVRLSKAYNNVEVEISEIESTDEFEYEKEIALREAKGLLDQLPDEGFGKSTSVTPTQYTKQTQVDKPTITKQSNFTVSDITNPHIKGGQKKIAVTKLNNGEITIDQVNSINGWADVQVILFGKTREEVANGYKKVLIMNAQEMFEKLGYRITKTNKKVSIEYEKTHDKMSKIYIYFNLKNKVQIAFLECVINGEIPLMLTVEEHKAIHQQMKELNWL